MAQFSEEEIANVSNNCLCGTAYCLGVIAVPFEFKKSKNHQVLRDSIVSHQVDCLVSNTVVGIKHLKHSIGERFYPH